VRTGKVLVASTTGVALALVAALVLMVNWLGARHYWRADWTRSRIYTLSEKSTNVLASIDKDVKVIVFMTPSTPLYSETKELLARYQAASPRLRVETIDPDREPLRTKQLAQEFGVSAANTIVFVAGERKKYVTSDQLAEYDYSGMQFGQGPKMKAFKGEEQITSAIMGVVNPKVPKIYATTGHGEHDLDGMGEDGLSQLKEALQRDNLTAEKTSLLSGTVPGDCDLLVLALPNGESMRGMAGWMGKAERIIDMGADFRLGSATAWKSSRASCRRSAKPSASLPKASRRSKSDARSWTPRARRSSSFDYSPSHRFC